MAALRLAVVPGHSLLWLACLPLALPSLSTLLLLLSGERRSLLVFHFDSMGCSCMLLALDVRRKVVFASSADTMGRRAWWRGGRCYIGRRNAGN